MKLKVFTKSLMCLALGGALIGCDAGESSDPATATRDDLNPPGSLETVTGDGNLTLWWSAGNVEEEFRGYYIFAAAASDVAGTYSYPAGADVNTVGIPRCADNTAFFEKFGLGTTDRECEGETEVVATEDPAFGLQEGEETPVEVEEVLTGWVPCTGDKANANLSLAGTAPVVSMQSCTIDKYWNGTELTAMKNGETYMFFVVAVMGDDLSQISWTSPLVQDTPSMDIIPQKDVTLSSNKYVKITFDTSTTPWTAQVSDEAACAAEPACTLSSSNGMTASGPTIFVGRQSDDGYKQRIFISASTSGSVALQPRGPQTAYGDGTATRIPGDEAASDYASKGTKYVVYENQIFDFQITDGADTYHGKVHVDSVDIAGGTNTGAATVKLAVVLQPKAGETHYMSFE